MTSYATVNRETTLGHITIELKSLNARFLDLQFRIQDDLRFIEPSLRKIIVSRVARGKVECRLNFNRKITDNTVQILNQSILNYLIQLQTQIHHQFTNVIPLSVQEVLNWPGVIEENKITNDALREDILITLEQVLLNFLQNRAREGLALQTTLLVRIEAMESIIHRITPLIPQSITQFQQKTIQRMQEILTLVIQLNGSQLISHEEIKERIFYEATLYGIRIDIAEELVRLSIHLNETRHILKQGGQVGKRLDFMMQELNREANTIGSKTTMKELSDASIALKLLIDQMREQVQNLE